MRSLVRDTLFFSPMVAAWGIAGYFALRFPTEWWAAGLCTFAGFVFFTAILAAIFRAGATRAFWTGFAAFGLAYALIVSIPGLREGMRPLLVSSPVLYHLYVRWNPPPTNGSTASPAVVTAPVALSAGSSVTFTPATSPTTNQITYQQLASFKTPTPVLSQLTAAPGGADPVLFENIGEALAALLIALVGGFAGRFLECTRAGRPLAERPSESETAKELTHEPEAQ
jgi:hypothetical protein